MIGVVADDLLWMILMGRRARTAKLRPVFVVCALREGDYMENNWNDLRA